MSKEIRAKYLDHIEKQKSSGLSIKKYCELNNISRRKYSYYQNYKPRSKKSSSKSFSRVQLLKSQDRVIKDRLNKFPSIDPHWLADFLKALHGAGF